MATEIELLIEKSRNLITEGKRIREASQAALSNSNELIAVMMHRQPANVEQKARHGFEPDHRSPTSGELIS